MFFSRENEPDLGDEVYGRESYSDSDSDYDYSDYVKLEPFTEAQIKANRLRSLKAELFMRQDELKRYEKYLEDAYKKYVAWSTHVAKHREAIYRLNKEIQELT